MYSMAREHLVSKQELVKVGALRSLSDLLGHESKQCRLNATATLYAVSCSGRPTCRELAQFNPLVRQPCRTVLFAPLCNALACAVSLVLVLAPPFLFQPPTAANPPHRSARPQPALKASVTPGLGRNAQDDQLQLFAALLIVNLLHVRGVAGGKYERASLEQCLTRAYEDATEEQARAQPSPPSPRRPALAAQPSPPPPRRRATVPPRHRAA